MSESPAPARRRRFAPLMLLAGLASAVLLSLSMTNTLSAFVDVLNNTQNTAGAGTMALVETSGALTCTSASATAVSCATINKYGGVTTMVPSDSNTAPTKNTVTTTVNFTNTGTATAASFTLSPGTCSPTGTGAPADTCAHFYVKVVSGGSTLYLGTLTGFTANVTLAVPAASTGSTTTVTFTTWLDTGASNSYQGFGVSQPLTFTLST